MKLLNLSPALLLLMILMPNAQATHSMPVEGNWQYAMNIDSIRPAGDNMVLKVTETGSWTGDFSGSSTMQVSGVLHSKGFITFEGIIYFEGSVLGKEGTLVIQYSGRVTSTNEIVSQWIILSGTGDLDGLKGQGVLSGVGGPGDNLQYSGNVHYSPD